VKKDCYYVSKKIVKNEKKIFEEVIINVRKYLKKKYGFSFSHQIVGSAKRNLVVRKGSTSWDIDYQFLFYNKSVEENTPAFIKKNVKQAFEKYLSDKYFVNISTSVITISPQENEDNKKPSFDVALLKTNIKTNNKEIIRGKSNNKNDSKKMMRWEELSNSSSIYSKKNKIRGHEMWAKMREIYKSKKCSNMNQSKDSQKSSFSLYLESIKETLDNFFE